MKLSLAAYFLVLLVSSCEFWFQWHRLVSHAAPCKDYFNSNPKPCYPQPVNVATKRNITASNTCGTPKSNYCEIGPGTRCFICDANSSLTMHPAQFMIDEESPFGRNPTWWQSDTWWDTNQIGISKMGEPLKVNITLNFGKSYHISGKIKVTFYSERPQAMLIERSADNELSWSPYQYFAKDCLATYGMSPTESVPAEDPFNVTCSEEYSGQFPSKNGIVEFQAYARYSPEDYLQPEVQQYLKATHVRLRLHYPGTDGLELINSEVTLNRYYYAISDIKVDGRCDCHGHAEFCDGVGMSQYCFCEHNTAGRDCEHCKPLYNNQPWKAANRTHANECQKCNCNDHATSCSYSSNLGTGVCIDCTHNTNGTHCDECVDGFYRNVDKALSDPDVCLACDCFSVGIVDNGSCQQKASEKTVLGQCNCKENVFGRRCDECVPGYWGFRLPPGGFCRDCQCNVLGTLNGSKECNQQTGNCYCKQLIEGDKCSECSDGYYSFPTKPGSSCSKCPCDLGGAYKTCDKQSGRCDCRKNVEGENCMAPKSGYFYPSFDYLLFEAELEEDNIEKHLERQSEKALFTGQGFVRLAPGIAVHFKNIHVNISWKYYVVFRYTASRLPHHNLTLTITSATTRNEIVVPSIDLQDGSGLGWTTNEPLIFHANQTYNVTIDFKNEGSMANAEMLLDSVVLKPDVRSVRVYNESSPEIVKTLQDCLQNASGLGNKKQSGSSCPALVFSHATEMYDGALACGCNTKGASQVGRCNAYGGQCYCYEGVGGRTCDYCLAGYHGFGDGGCKVCQCNSIGIKSDICDLTSGICQCRSSVTGAKCDECKRGTFDLNSRNVQGCQSCFGYGHGAECKSAQGFVQSKIASNFTGGGLDGWHIKGNSSTATNIGKDGLDIYPNLTLVAPPKYLSEQLKSYKQRIVIKAASTSTDNLPRNAMYVNLEGHGYKVLLRASSNTSSQDFTEFSFIVNEQNILSELQFQSMLSNLTSLVVMIQSRLILKEIFLESAVYSPGSDSASHVSFVENMTCFENYTGLSCESCAPGFTRSIPNSGPFSNCVRCSCNDRAEDCDPESGVCIDCDLGSTGDHCERCEYHVIGPHCNVCADGFYGLTQDDRKCKPCDCHLPGTLYGNTSSCNLTTGQCECNQTLHTGGRRCNVCQENAWNRSDSSSCEECPPCYGMVKVEVDKFRQNFSMLVSGVNSLSEILTSSGSEPFSDRIQRTKEDVEGLIKTSETLRKSQDEVKLELDKDFEVIGILDNNQKRQTSEVNATLNATAKIIGDYNDTMKIFGDTQALVKESYHLLNNTVRDLMDQLEKPINLLRQWSIALNETKVLSQTKVNNIVHTHDSIKSDLENAVRLTTQAATDVLSVVTMFQSLLLKVPDLQANRSSIKETGESMLNVAHQHYHNASVLFHAALEHNMMDHSTNMSENITRLNERFGEVRKNASDIIKTIQNQVQSTLPILTEIQQTLEKLPTLQAHVAAAQNKAQKLYSESLQYQADGKAAISQAEKHYSDVRDILTTVRDFKTVVQESKTRSDQAIGSISEMSAFHRSNILFAKNISKTVESAHKQSDTLVGLSKTVKDSADQEREAILKSSALSKKLKNDTVAGQGIAGTNKAVVDYINAMVTPIQKKCSSVTKDIQGVVINVTRTKPSAVQLLEKMRNVSRELQQIMNDFRALPSINTKPLSDMKADIVRIRASFQALKLTSSLEKLRKGKITQDKWMAAHKPTVATLRSKVAILHNLIGSLNTVRCK